MQRKEWIDRAVAAGAHSADYADSLFEAYTDMAGESDLTPEEVVAEDARIRMIGSGKLTPNCLITSASTDAQKNDDA